MPAKPVEPKQGKGSESWGMRDSRPDAKGDKVGGPTPVGK